MVRNPVRIQEWFGDCLARIIPGALRAEQARLAGLEVLNSEFWVLSAKFRVPQPSARLTSHVFPARLA